MVVRSFLYVTMTNLEANRNHLWVITIIASLLLHLMMKCFAKGITFWILTLHNEQKWIRQMSFSCQVFVSLKSASGDVLVGLWSFFQERLKVSPGTDCEPQGNTQNQNLPLVRCAGTLQSPISGVLKCEGDMTSVILTGVWAAGRNGNGVSRIDHWWNKWLLRAPLRFTECLWIGLKCI